MVLSLWFNDTERGDEFFGGIDDVYYLLRGSFSNQNVLFLIKYDNFQKTKHFPSVLEKNHHFSVFCTALIEKHEKRGLRQVCQHSFLQSMKKPVHNLQQLKAYLLSNYSPGTAKINFGSLYQIPVGPQGIRMLIDHLQWPIQTFNISMHAAGDEGMQMVIAKNDPQGKAPWRSLKEFVCIKNQVTNEGLRGIEKVDWPCLEGLSLNDNRIDRAGVQILAKTNFSKTLKKLFLGGNSIGIGGCEILSRTDWPNFQRLGLNYNFITNEGLAFLQLAHWPRLLEINLSNNKLDAKGMVYLQQADWPLLQFIILSRNRIGLVNETQLTDEGCFHLSRMKTKSLHNLGVFGNEISLNGIRMIFRSGILTQNCFLELAKNKFTFLDVRPYLMEFDLFCNQFED